MFDDKDCVNNKPTFDEIYFTTQQLLSSIVNILLE